MGDDDEKQGEIDKLKKENEELVEKLRILELEKKEAKPTVPDNTLNEIWAALGLLQKQIVESAHTVQQNMDAISVKVDRVHDTVVKQAERFNSVEWRLNSILTQTKGETILLMGGLKNNGAEGTAMAVLSANRSKWIELQLKLPYDDFGSGAVYLNGEIYLLGGYYN